MERENEVILRNAILENVLRYLYDKLKGISGKTFEETHNDGTIYYYTIQNLFPSNSNKIEVKFTTTVTPEGNIEKAHGYWGDLIAMSFEGLQLQTNTVLIKAECKHPFILSIFDSYWDEMLKAFGAAQPASVEQSAGQKEPGLLKLVLAGDTEAGKTFYKMMRKWAQAVEAEQQELLSLEQLYGYR
jgi:hypothetical protein